MTDKPSIDSIFCEAIEIESSDERASYLETVCGGDAELRRQVDRLLHAHFRSGSILDSPAHELGPGLNLPLTEKPGDTIGPYKLLELIGEGGMGLVYMAEQQQPVRRTVALKIIKPGMDTRQVIARFEVERQALAMMDHHNIARVLDANTTDSGRPYFVMELVKGIHITEYCDKNRLTPLDRLELFVPVCHAIQHAHQKGIIHRDIKPTNVLVAQYDGQPVPKVIDFGIAKATEQKLTERTVFTSMGQVLGTLEYMSPEQAEMNQRDIDTRSDVYSLGVLLYELLTGSTPITKQQLRDVGFEEMLRTVRETEPPKPSSRLSESKGDLPSISAVRNIEPAKLSRFIRGDLDWIVMKALDKQRSRRFQTADQLARDVERFLADEPVEARPPSATYQLHKFVRKNWRVLSVLTAFAIVLCLGTVISTWQAVRAYRSEQESAKRAAENLSQLVQTNVATGARYLQDGNYPEAALHFAEALRLDDDPRRERLHRIRCWSTLQACVKPSAVWPIDRPSKRIRISPDGHFIVTFDGENLRASESPGAAQIWDADSRKCVATLQHEAGVHDADISSDGKFLVTASDDGTVRLWDLRTGNQLGSELKHKLRVLRVSFNDTSDRIVASTGVFMEPERDQSSASVWTVPEGQLVCTLAHDDSVYDAAFSPDGKSIATVCRDKMVRLWNANTGEALSQPFKHPDVGVSALALGIVRFSLNGAQLVTSSFGLEYGGWTHADDMKCWVWDVESGKLKMGPLVGQLLDLSSDGRQMLTSTGVAVYLWRLDEHSPQELPLREGSSTFGQFSPQDRFVAIHDGNNSSVEVWDTSKRELAFAPLIQPGSISAVRFMPDGRRLITLAAQEQLRIWDLASAEYPRQCVLTAQGKVDSATEPPYFENVRGTLRITDLEAGKQIEPFLEGLFEKPCEAEFSSNNRQLLVYCQYRVGPVQVWDVQKRELVSTFMADQTRDVLWATFSPNGRYIATKLRGGQAQLWDASTGQAVSPPLANSSDFSHVSFSIDGQRIVTCDSSQPLAREATGSADVWSVPDGEPLKRLQHTVRVEQAEFSPDGNRIVTVGTNESMSTVEVWDLASERPVLVIPVHDYVSRAVFSSQGRRIITVSNSGARVWDAESGLPLTPSMRQTGAFRSWVERDGLLYMEYKTDFRDPHSESYGSESQAQLWDLASGHPVTAPLKAYSSDWELGMRSLSSDGRHVIGSERHGIDVQPILSDNRAADLIVKTAQLLAGYELTGAGGKMPFTVSEFQRRWKALHDEAPENWSATRDQRDHWNIRAAKWHWSKTAWAMTKGNWEKVIAHSSRGIELLPNDSYMLPLAIAHRGDTYASRGNLEPATLDFERSVRLGGDSEAQQKLAYCYLATGRLDDFRRVCAEMLQEIEANEKSPLRNRLRLAEASVVMPDTFDDWARLLRLLEIDDQRVRRLKAAVLCRAGKYDESLELFASIKSPSVEDQLFQAIANHHRGNQEQVQANLAKANADRSEQISMDWHERFRMDRLGDEVATLTGTEPR